MEEFGLKKCLVGSMTDHIKDTELPMITFKNCKDNGMLIDSLEIEELRKYQTHDIIFFVAMPVKQSAREMSRLFQYLIGDIDVSLRSDYIRKLQGNLI